MYRKSNSRTFKDQSIFKDFQGLENQKIKFKDFQGPGCALDQRIPGKQILKRRYGQLDTSTAGELWPMFQ